MSKAGKIKEKIQNDHGIFYDATLGMSLEELKKDLLKYTKNLQDILVAIKTKPEILEAEEKKKKVEKPYKDAIKEHKLTIQELKSLVDKAVCVPDLENQLVKYAQLVEEQKFKLDIDEDVKEAKDELDTIKGPYTEAKGVHELKIAYLHILINEKQGFEPHNSAEN